MAATTTLWQKTTRAAEDWFGSPAGSARLPPLEGLRGLAVLMIFLVHAHAVFGAYAAGHSRLFSVSEYLGQIGNAGADLFFVISGFIIYGALARKRFRYFSFLGRRLKRIYPVFLTVLCCYLALSIVFPSESRLPGEAPAAVKYILANVLFLPGICPITPIVTVAWSLSFEFAFYLSVPLIVFCLSRGGLAEQAGSKGRRAALIMAMAAVFSASEACFLHGAHIRMLSFLAGMLLREVIAGGWISPRFARIGEPASMVALILLASYRFALRPGAHASAVLSMSLLSAALFFFVFYALAHRGALHTVCAWKPVRYWGNISYSYYLAHGLTLKGLAVLLARIGTHGHPLAMYFCALVLGLAASWISAAVLYLLVEKPLSLAPMQPRASMQEAAAPALC